MASDEIIKINKRQKEFYETKKKNFATQIWSFFRNGLLNNLKKDIGVEKDIYGIHKKWFGELSTKKVLDLGCYEGNALSIYLAQNARDYVGIDLSEKAISRLNERLKGYENAKAVAVDFYSEDFKEENFDLIYAYGVLHHFKDTNELINRLKQKLKSGGEIISNDPLETSMPVKFLRRIYRPFQSDKDWEWPFSEQVYYKYSKAFKIKERRAVLGKAKWFFLINLLPLSSGKKQKIGKSWHLQDWEKSSSSDTHMFKCMHLTMLMEKKN